MEVWIRPYVATKEQGGVTKVVYDIHRELCLDPAPGSGNAQKDVERILGTNHKIDTAVAISDKVIVDLLVDGEIAIKFNVRLEKREIIKIAKEYCSNKRIKAFIVVTEREMWLARTYFKKPCFVFDIGPVFGVMSSIEDGFQEEVYVNGDFSRAEKELEKKIQDNKNRKLLDNTFPAGGL